MTIAERRRRSPVYSPLCSNEDVISLENSCRRIRESVKSSHLVSIRIKLSHEVVNLSKARGFSFGATPRALPLFTAFAAQFDIDLTLTHSRLIPTPKHRRK